MSLDLLSILLLAAAIIIGFLTKVNVGILSISFALVLGHIMGVTDKAIISGFGSNLFVTLVGVTFLFSILTENNTIELLAKKIVSLIGSKSWLLPIIIFLTGYGLTAIGPGSIPILAIMPVFAVPVAIARGYHPLMMALIGDFGIFAGRMSPITPESILVHELLAKDNIISAVTGPIIANQTITGVICALLAFIYYKGYNVSSTSFQTTHLPRFTKEQRVSLLGLAVMVVAVIGFKYNVGLVSFAIGAILLCIKAGHEGPSIKGIPWGVLLMICGVGVLMKLVVDAGGIQLMSAALSVLMNSYTASAVMGVTSGIMSWFSSGLGVVFPTLIPVVGPLANSLGHVSPVELASLVVIGGTFTGVSPFSSTGGLIMAAVMTNQNMTGESQQLSSNNVFMELIIWSVITLVVLTLLALCGVYSLFL